MIKLSKDELLEIKELLETKILIDLYRHQSIFTQNRELARNRLNELALLKGAPELCDYEFYGVDEDGIIIGPDGTPVGIKQ